MGFPRQVNVQPAVAVAGDFASDNPRATVIAGVGAFIAGALGLTVAAFAWSDPDDPALLNSFGSGPVTGFIGREGLRADIITPGPGYPDASMTILGGSFITAYSTGDFFVVNNGAAASVIGQKAYADFSTGLASFAATGTPPTSAVIGAGTIAKNVLNVSAIAINAFTGSISGTTLTVSAVATGGLFPDQVIAGGNTSNPVDPGTVIVSQLTGSAGGTGTYEVSISQTVASGSMTGSGGLLTVTSLTSGKVWVGQSITHSSVQVGTLVTAQVSGSGGAGTYAVSVAQTVASVATGVLSGAVLTATTLTSGALRENDTLSSTSGTSSILPFGTGGTTGVGIGGSTTYALSDDGNYGDTDFTVKSGVETKWYAMSANAVGELVTISATPLG